MPLATGKMFHCNVQVELQRILQREQKRHGVLIKQVRRLIPATDFFILRLIMVAPCHESQLSKSKNEPTQFKN